MAIESKTVNGNNSLSIEKPFQARLYINGKFVEASDKKTFKLRSPATLDVVGEVSEASVEDTNDAVAAAKAAQPSWAALTPSQRGSHMKKLAALIRESHSELAHLEALSMGRPVKIYFESFAAASALEYFAEAGYNAQGKSSLNTPGFVNMTFKQPFGVVAVIIPWNVPILFFVQKAAPALAAGNAVVIKSSEKAPLTSAYAASLIDKVGFPPGVINVLSGHGAGSGATLSSHMDVRALSFTGSGRTSRIIQQAAAKSNLKNCTFELGGSSPALVFDDADLPKAVEDTQFSVQFNSGQVCMANRRIYVQDTIADRFIAEFKEKFKAVNIGDPTSESTNHGPLVDEIQYRNVISYIEGGKKQGKLALGGEEHKGKGYFVKPTMFLETPEDAQIMREEVFGPVTNINIFKTEEEALAKANNTEYGLYAAVYTKNIDRAMRVAKGFEAGTVGVNCTSPTGAEDMPFGGWKASGIGREGIHESMDHFLETKSVLIKIDSS